MIITTISNITQHLVTAGYRLSALHLSVHFISQRSNEGQAIFFILKMRKLRQGG